MSYFSRHLAGPAHALFSSDSLETHNERDDQGLEAGISLQHNINTGVD